MALIGHSFGIIAVAGVKFSAGLSFQVLFLAHINIAVSGGGSAERGSHAAAQEGPR